jgi:hypothetical protein
MAAIGTQKTPDQAAALIQARVRGRQQRRRDQRAIVRGGPIEIGLEMASQDHNC